MLNAPTFERGSNDYSFWSGDAVVDYNMLNSTKRLFLVPNYNHGFGAYGYRVPDQAIQWMGWTLNNADAHTTITDPVRHGDEYSFSATSPLPIKSATLYYSFGNPVWPSRYWIAIPATADGSNWKASIPKQFTGLSGCVYALVVDNVNRAAASRYIPRKGADPDAPGGPMWKDGAFWDIDTGIGAWRIPGAGRIYGVDKSHLELAGSDGFKVTPVDNEKFELLTNSVSLMRSYAAKKKGIRLVIDGQGQAGRVRVSLNKDTSSPDEIEYAKTIDYGAALQTIDIPWFEFACAAGTASPTAPFPFDDIRFDGERKDKAPLIVQSMTLYE